MSCALSFLVLFSLCDSYFIFFCLFFFFFFFFFFQAEDGIRDADVTGVQTCALPILVPAHVGHFQAFAVFGEVVAEVADFGREQADAFHAAVFFAAGHQGLHANADAEERAVLGDFFNKFNHTQAVHFGHAVADGADAGQDYPVGFADFGGIVCDQYGAVRGHVLYGFAGGMQVAHAVVDDGDGLHGGSVPIGDRLQGAFGGRGDTRHALVHFNRHAQCAAEGFEHGFNLVVGVLALQVVDVQGHHGVVHEALEELCEQVYVKPAHAGAGVGYVHEQTRAAGEIDDHAGQGFIQGHVGVAVTADAFLVAHRLLERLAEGDADIFHGVVVVDVEVALAGDVQVYQAVAGNLVHHVVKEGHTGVKAGFAGAIEIDLDGNLGFKGISLYPSLAFSHGDSV